MAVPEAHWQAGSAGMPHGQEDVYNQVSFRLLSLLPWGYSRRRLQAQGICWIRNLSTDAVEDWPAVFENATTVRLWSPSTASYITPQRFPKLQKLYLCCFDEKGHVTLQAVQEWPAVFEDVTTVILTAPSAAPYITPQRFPGLQRLQICCVYENYDEHPVTLQGFDALTHLTLADCWSLPKIHNIPDACDVCCQGLGCDSLQAFVDELKLNNLHNVSRLEIGLRNKPGAVSVQALAVLDRLVKVKLRMYQGTNRFKHKRYFLGGFDSFDHDVQFIIDTHNDDGCLLVELPREWQHFRDSAGCDIVTNISSKSAIGHQLDMCRQ